MDDEEDQRYEAARKMVEEQLQQEAINRTNHFLQHQQEQYQARAENNQLYQHEHLPPTVTYSLLPSQPTTHQEVRTLWIGGLQQDIDENYLYSLLSNVTQLVSIRVIRNAGESLGYGYLEFSSHAHADTFLSTYNGYPIQGTASFFNMNWASFGIGVNTSVEDDLDRPYIVVDDLALDVTDDLLYQTFAAHYPSVIGAQVSVNGGIKTGLVKFDNMMEMQRAVREMQKAYCSSKPMTILAGTNKPDHLVLTHARANRHPQTVYPPTVEPILPLHVDITNSSDTTIFIGNLDRDVTEDEVRNEFQSLGEIRTVRIPANKGCGFVEFAQRSVSEYAIKMMQGHHIRGQPIRISRGTIPVPDQEQWLPRLFVQYPNQEAQAAQQQEQQPQQGEGHRELLEEFQLQQRQMHEHQQLYHQQLYQQQRQNYEAYQYQYQQEQQYQPYQYQQQHHPGG